jgi:hypothetical protein
MSGLDDEEEKKKEQPQRRQGNTDENPNLMLSDATVSLQLTKVNKSASNNQGAKFS